MQHDTTKLPLWAQQRIRLLEQGIAGYKERERRTVEGETDVWIEDSYSYDGPDQPLPPDTIIKFKLPNGDLRVDGRDGRLHLMALGGRLAIYPSGGVNTATIAVEAF